MKKCITGNKKKNILLLFPDQHRGDWMPNSSKLNSKMQHKIELNMPTLSTMMEEGFVFNCATTPSPLCAPARACLASGKNFFNCGVETNMVNYPTGQKTFYNVLKDNGYNVLSSGKLDVHKATKYWGVKGWVDSLGEMGFTNAIDNEGKIDTIIGEICSEKGNPSGNIKKLIDVEKDHERGPYINYLYQKGMAKYHVEDMDRRQKDGRDISITKLRDDDYCDNWLTRNAIQLLKEMPKNEPWFMQVNFTGPHDPWDITQSMWDKVKERTYEKPICGDLQHEEKDVAIRARYSSMLENIDANIKKIIDYITERDELEDTIIIYASDHGEMLGEFGTYGKCVANKGSIHIPLIIWGKDIVSGKSDALVQLQDLAATILDLSGVAQEKFGDSISLQPILNGTKNEHRKVQISALNDWWCISDGSYKLVRKKGGKSLLFDTQKDPWEENDISAQNEILVLQLQEIFQKQTNVCW